MHSSQAYISSWLVRVQNIPMDFEKQEAAACLNMKSQQSCFKFQLVLEEMTATVVDIVLSN